MAHGDRTGDPSVRTPYKDNRKRDRRHHHNRIPVRPAGVGRGVRPESEGADPIGSAPVDLDSRSGAGNRSGAYRNRALIVPRLTVSSLTEQLTMGSPSSNGSNVYTPQASWMMPVALL